jgi:glutathione S-transferase
MSELVFYTHPQSRGRIAHWMMEELGQPYRTVWLNFGPEMKSADYKAVNPMGKVPALQYGSVVVTEAAAVCAWLADAFPQAGLAPAPTSPERAPYLRWLFFAAGPLEQAATAKALGWTVPEGREGMAGFGSLADTLNALETALRPGPYICGQQFTAADVYVGSSLAWGLMFGTIEARPVFVDYVARLKARPASQRADAINEERIKAPTAG